MKKTGPPGLEPRSTGPEPVMIAATPRALFVLRSKDQRNLLKKKISLFSLSAFYSFLCFIFRIHLILTSKIN